MSHKIKSRRSAVTRSVEVESDHIALPSALHKGIVAYRAVFTERVTTVRNKRTYEKKPTVRTYSGVCKKSELDALLSGKVQMAPSHASVPRGCWTSAIIAVRPEYLEAARKIAWRIPHDENPYEGTDVEDPLTAIENGEEVIFIESYGASHQLFDLDGEALPVALFFNYTDGGFSEGKYDLVKAVEILRKRDDITLEEGGGERFPGSWSGDPEDPRRYVGTIPYYNAGRGRTACIEFGWHPSVEDFRTVWAAALKLRADPGSDEVRRAVFDTDILGLRAGGAAHFDDYYKTRRDFRDQDDEDYDNDCYC